MKRAGIFISIMFLILAGVTTFATGQDFTGRENHLVARRTEVNSVAIENGTFMRPAAFESWRSIYWVMPNSGATSINVSVTVATGLNITFKQDGTMKTADSNNNTFSASFGTNNGKAMTEIEVIVSDGTTERSYYLDVCAKDPLSHDVVAEYYGLLPFPGTRGNTRVLIDQIMNAHGMTWEQINFVAYYLTGSQKNSRELIDPVKAINPYWHSLHYHLAIWNGDASIIINNEWTNSEWQDVSTNLFQKDPYVFLYAVDKTTGQTTWVDDNADKSVHAYLMNITNETYYQYLLNNLVYQCTSTGYDAIFFDSYSMACVYSFTDGRYINFGGGSSVPYDFEQYQNPQLGELTWVQASEEYISRMNKDLNKRGIWLLPNLGDMTTTWDPIDYAYSNGGMLEATPIHPDNSGNIGDTYYLYNWIQSMSRTMFLTQKDRVIFLQPYLNDVNNLDYRMFVIGEYLMVKGNYTYINMSTDGQMQASWYPEYEIDLGAPMQTSVIPDNIFTAGKESIDKALLNYKEGNLFIRRFEKGMVILNPNNTSQPYTVPTDKSYQMAVASGGGTVPEAGIGGLQYSLKWTDVPTGATEIIPATGALILRFAESPSSPIITWSPTPSSTDWNKADNWTPTGVPGANSVVIIPGPDKASSFPDLTAGLTPFAAADEIHFAPGAKLGHQNLLNYNKAFVRYDLSVRDKWHMLSMPLGQAYPGDFAFGGYPVTTVRSFTSSTGGSITTGGWFTAAGGNRNAFTFGDAFVLWLNRDNEPVTPADIGNKGLPLLNNIHEIPYFQNYADGSPTIDKYRAVDLAQDYNVGSISTTFHNFKFNTATQMYERYDGSDTPPYTVPRSDAAYRLAGNEISKAISFVTNNQAKGDIAFIGNPFMADLDFDAFSAYTGNNALIKPAYQIWIGGDNGGYNVFSPTGSAGIITDNSTGQYIAPLQGFIVERLESAGMKGTLLFENTMTSVNNNNVVLRSSTDNANKLDIVARNPIAGVLTFIADRADGKDEFGDRDVRKITNGVNGVPEIYTLKPYNGGSVATAINIINNDNLLIPLGLSTSFNGNITFSFGGMNIYDAKLTFIDAVAGKEIDLTGLNSFDYTFNYAPQTVNGTVAACEDRFFIRISKTITGLTNPLAEKVNVYETDGRIRIVSSASNRITGADVYNLQGVLIYKSPSLQAISYTIDRDFPAGVYIVKVISEKNGDNLKLIIR